MDATSVLNLRHWSDKTQGDPSFLPRLFLVRIYKNRPEELHIEQKGAGSHLEGLTQPEAMEVESAVTES